MIFYVLLYLLLLVGIGYFPFYLRKVIKNKKIKSNRNKINNIEYYPPEGLNSAEVAFLYKGYIETDEVTSFLIYLAIKGYIKIEKVKLESVITDKKNYKITKLKDYDGNNESEALFMKRLFSTYGAQIMETEDYKNFMKKSSDKPYMPEQEISTNLQENIDENLYDVFYNTLNEIADNINSDTNYYKVFSETSTKKTMKNRTPYGQEMYEKINSFKLFLESASKEELNELLLKNPNYFYDMIPYAYSLNVYDRWIKKVDGLFLQPPSWYSGYDEFNIKEFLKFINTVMYYISSSFSSFDAGDLI